MNATPNAAIAPRGQQRDGTCWLGGTEWAGQAVMRLSFSNWSTTDVDVDRAGAAIARVLA
jgi:hypothetical protein